MAKKNNKAQEIGAKLANNLKKQTVDRIKSQIIKKVVMLLVSLVQAIVVALITLFGWLLIPLLLVILVAAVFFEITYNIPSKTGAFTLEAGEIANAVSGMFYSEYANRSYYIMIDDDPKIYQAGSDEWEERKKEEGVDAVVEDIDNREKQFALSATTLSTLDRFLNDGYIIPEQFIKPVYNSCMVDDYEDDEPENSINRTLCNLLQLTDEDGNLVVDSNYYRLRKSDEKEPITDTIGEVDNPETSDAANAIYDKNPSATQKGVWDWGLGSIIHYKSFIQDSRVANIQVQDLVTWDAENRKVVKTTNPSSEQIEEASKTMGISEPPTVIEYEDQGKYNLNNPIPEDEKKYTIDEATTFAGTIKNTVSQRWINQGRSGYGKTYSNYYYEYHSDADEEVSANSGAIRKAYIADSLTFQDVAYSSDNNRFGHIVVNAEPYITGFKTAELRSSTESNEVEVENPNYNQLKCMVENSLWISGGMFNPLDPDYRKDFEETDQYRKYCVKTTSEIETNTNYYYVFDGDYSNPLPVNDPDEVKFTVEYNPEISYYNEGDLQLNAVTYPKDNPDTSKITGIDYLKDYLENYRVFIPAEADQSLTCTIKQVGMDDVKYGVSSYDDCLDGIISKKDSNGYMDAFHMDEVGDKNLEAIMEAFPAIQEHIDEEVDNEENSDDEIEIKELELTYLTNDEVKGHKTEISRILNKYGKYFSDAETKYGIPKKLLAAIARQETNGNHEAYIGDDRKNTGFGLMQIENPANEREITAYNFSTRSKETLKINVSNMSNVELNIKAAAMELQNRLVEYKYNVPMAIQSYNYGSGGLDAVLSIYEDEFGIDKDTAIADLYNYTWTMYTYEVHINPSKYIDGWEEKVFGDYEYVVNVLKPISDEQLNFQNATEGSQLHTIKTYNLSSLFRNQSDRELNEAKENMAYMEDLYNTYKGNKIKENWNLITLNQKSYFKGIYGSKDEEDIKSAIRNQSPNVANMIVADNKADIDYDLIISTMISSNEGVSPSSYDYLDDDFFESKYSVLFSTLRSTPWKSTINANLVFGGQARKPVDRYIVVEEPGYVKNNIGVTEFNDSLKIKVAANTEVRAVYDGTVTSVSDALTLEGYRYIIIHHNAISDNDYSKDTYTGYYDLGNIKVKEGQEVKAGEVIGNSLTETESIIELNLTYGKHTANLLDVLQGNSGRIIAIGDGEVEFDTSSKYYSEGGYGVGTNLVGQCTWWAYGRASEVNDTWLPVISGNAGRWYDNAAAAGYSVGSEPSSNSFAIWYYYTGPTYGWAGHVRYVEAFDGSTILWSGGQETATMPGGSNNDLTMGFSGVASATQDVSAFENDMPGFMGYIYIDSVLD